MGNQICQECTHGQHPISDPIYISDSEAPHPDYAINQNIAYEIPCEVNHVFTELLPTSVPENFARGRKLGDSYFIIPYSVYYTGEWDKGRPQGLGEVVFKSGSILYGTFNKGVAEGEDCLFIMESGSYYRGNMLKNQFSGHGVFCENNGHKHEGKWEHNVPHGPGREIYANGDEYIGQFVEGVKKGQNSRYVWKKHPEFLQYKGNFNNYIEGEGVLTKNDGTIIAGSFQGTNCVKNAIAKNSEYEYEGDLIDGKLEGQGKITFLKSGERYQGTFSKGQLHGQGTLTTAKGEKKIGKWHNGKLIRSSKGLSEPQIDQIIELVSKKFDSSKYVEDAIQELNQKLGNSRKPYTASVETQYSSNKISSSRYIVVDIGSCIVAIVGK